MKRTDGLLEEFPFPSWYLVMALRETIAVYEDTLSHGYMSVGDSMV